MTRRVLYVAAPVRPTGEEIRLAGSPLSEHPTGSMMSVDAYHYYADRALRANLDRAMAWLHWMRRSFPETTFIAPWIASILAGEDDADPAQREAGLTDACAVIERCDGIVLCGPRISEGMRREMEHGTASHGRWRFGEAFEVYDLTGMLLPGTAPLALSSPYTFREWYGEHGLDHIEVP